MGDIGVRETASEVDLLSLIGNAIAHLQRSIELFDAADRAAGLGQLTGVIDDIDRYLNQLDKDPLVQLARIDSSCLVDCLHHVQDDLSNVIRELRSPTP